MRMRAKHLRPHGWEPGRKAPRGRKRRSRTSGSVPEAMVSQVDPDRWAAMKRRPLGLRWPGWVVSQSIYSD